MKEVEITIKVKMNERKGLLLKYHYRQARPIIRENRPDYRSFL